VVAGVASDGADGQVPDDRVAVPLSAYGSVVGSLRYRPPVTALRPRDRQLLDDLAGHLGGVLHAARLTADLQGARERLVLAREEERRRLRRDLHDGLGPAMAGHLLRLDVIASKVGSGSPAAEDVDALREELRGTVLEVRRVVEGLRPPALDELGLGAALAQAAERLTSGAGVSLDLRVGELPSLPAAVEVAAYRIVTEAVTNVVRHASATCCRVDVAAAERVLRLTVQDDGRGASSDLVRGGHGLQTMRERAEELRGRLQVLSVDGTTVIAELPLPRPARSSRSSLQVTKASAP
jgi:signal transduction histidine kinase